MLKAMRDIAIIDINCITAPNQPRRQQSGADGMNHRAYLALAIPLTISTITTPLLGADDTAVVGQLPNPAYISGVAVGNHIFYTTSLLV